MFTVVAFQILRHCARDWKNSRIWDGGKEILDKLVYANAAKLFGLEGDITRELRESVPSFEKE